MNDHELSKLIFEYGSLHDWVDTLDEWLRITVSETYNSKLTNRTERLSIVYGHKKLREIFEKAWVKYQDIERINGSSSS